MTNPENSTNLMATTSVNALVATLTPAERLYGRFLRAPDHGEDGGGAGADADQGDDKGGGAQDADDAGENKSSLISDAKADVVDGDKGGDDKAEGEDGDKKDATAEAPPEKYELTPPEGMEIDDTLLAEADPVLRELGLTNEAANKLMPLVGKVAERITSAQNDAFQAQATEWAKQAKAAPDLGGKNWTQTENYVAKAMDVAGEKLPTITVKDADGKTVKLTGAQQVAQFKELLDNTKLGNHPILMRMFRFYGQQFSEGGDLARSDAAAPVKQDRLESLYPDDVPKKANA